MILCFFAPTIRHRSQAIVRKSFFRFIDSVWRYFRAVMICESKSLFGVHDRPAFCAIQNLQWLNLHRLAIKNPLTGSNNSLRGTNNVFRDTNNSLTGTKNVFRDTNNSLMGTNKPSKNAQPILIQSLQSVKCFCTPAFIRSVSGSSCENISSDCNKVVDHVCMSKIDMLKINRSTAPECMQNYGRHSRLRSRLVTRRVRDREPSRVSLKKVMRSLKCRKVRRKHSKMLQNSVPVSSLLHIIVSNYKQWNIRYIQRQDSFYSNHFMKTKKSTVAYYVLEQNLLLSGDIELNPGPVTNTNQTSTSYRAIANDSFDFVFNNRLLRHGLRPLDVGGGGDCFFKSVSHQLYGDSCHHLEIRAAGVQYLKDNPERFIESNLDTSWLQYLSNMSMQGTWADNIIIQAVADAMNIKIHIIESNENFSDMTLVEATNVIQNPRSVYLGHISEVHYISTCSAFSNMVEYQKKKMRTNDVEFEKTCNINSSKPTNLNRIPSNSKKRKEQKTNYMRQYRAAKATIEEKEKQKIYMKRYRASKASAEEKEKTNEYKRKYRRQYKRQKEMNTRKTIEHLKHLPKCQVIVCNFLFQTFMK